MNIICNGQMTIMPDEQCKSFSVPGFEGLMFVVHPSFNSPLMFSASEWTTGALIYNTTFEHYTEAEAIKSLVDKLESVGRRALFKALAEMEPINHPVAHRYV